MLLSEYRNGNYNVKLYDDGTKVRETEGDEFIPDFAECIDITISTRCNHGCEYCYAGCTPDGKRADLKAFEPLLNTIHEGTEIAINVNGSEDPEALRAFLEYLRDRKVIVNATIRQDDFEKHREKLLEFEDEHLVYGVGVSLLDPTPEFITYAKEFPNLVIHVINKIVTPQQIDALAGNDLRLLILGYKTVGRGVAYLNSDGDRISWRGEYLHDHISQYFDAFKVISFDNLALEQIEIRRFLTDEEWNRFYQGDEGTSTFFLNLAEGYFARDSLTPNKHAPLLDSVDEMFHIIREEVGK